MKTQPKEERNILPQEDSSDFLPPSYALVNSPPPMENIRLRSIIPDIQHSLIEAQGGTSMDNLLRGEVYRVADADFKMETRSASEDTKVSLFIPRSRHLKSHDLTLHAETRMKWELLQPVKDFAEFLNEDQEGFSRIRRLYGKKLYFVTGLITLVDANWNVAKQGSRVTKPYTATTYSIGANLLGLSDGVDHGVKPGERNEQLGFVSPGDRVYAVGYRAIKFPRLGLGVPKLDTQTWWHILAGDFGSTGYTASS
jgi:hypothetical protein